MSEFRIESGLNCGGHAFATDGFLLGPILEDFKAGKQELLESLFEIYSAAQLKKNNRSISSIPPVLFSVQGGIGTAAEDQFLHNHYEIGTTGWGLRFYWFRKLPLLMKKHCNCWPHPKKRMWS